MKHPYTVSRGTLDGVEAFVRVAERRSFSQAAADLAVTPSAVSQAVRALEARMGVALFARTTRSVGLTEAGERFLARARPAIEEIAAARNEARDLGAKPSGLLRLAVPRAVVPLVVQPVLASFSEAFPDIVVEIAASDELVDLAKGGFDAGIRMGESIDDDMVAVRLTRPLRRIVLGSPAYFERHGRPQTPADLAAHACVRIRRSGGALAHWRLEGRDGTIELAVSGPLVVNDFQTMLSAALDGVGLAQMPEPIAAKHVRSGELEEVLAEYASSTSGLFLYFPSRNQVMPKLRAFIDHITASGAAANSAANSAAGSPAPQAGAARTARKR
jgi:DNA-binding transcriptional LysR family regulator